MKKVSLLLVLIFATLTVSAQESGFSTKAGRNATFARNGFWDNWFIGVGAGANFYFGNNEADFFDRAKVAPTLQFGKWFNPYIGGRVKVTGGPLESNIDRSGNNSVKFNYINPEFNFMWNVSNYLGKYNENRLYSFIPYVGMGAAFGWDYELNGTTPWGNAPQRSLTLSAGIINKFRLSNRLSVDLEFSGAFLRDDFDKRQEPVELYYDGLLNGSLSLVYKIGSKTDFSEALLMDQGLVDDLNNQINRLRQENARLAQRPENCPKCPEAKTIEKVIKQGGSFVSNVVFFRIGSANIDKQQEISIFNTAKYLQENPNAKVKIVGYADKQTGTPSINEKLSEKRAKNVANALIKTYNIDSSRVTVEWKGDTVQPYAENDWNRVAIFFVE